MGGDLLGKAPPRFTCIRGSDPTLAFDQRLLTKGLEAGVGFDIMRSMRCDEAIMRLKRHESDLRKLGVESLYIFGSTARNAARPDSDIDLFFDYAKGKLGIFELMDVKECAAGILGRATDIMTRDSLHRALRPQIEASAVRVF